MAFSAHKTEEEIREHVVSNDEVSLMASELAAMIRESRYFVCFTGAGISTSAGIPDFRGPDGVWTLRAKGEHRKKKTTSVLAAIPTSTHMCLVALEKKGFLKFLISQNCDGLHRKSGFPSGKLAELHGNTNLETCVDCGKEYMRDYGCRASGIGVHKHATGRNCVTCGGTLIDSIINFGENLKSKPLEDGFKNSEKADLHLVLGSSLTVTPAADMPKLTVKRGGSLVICNKQITPHDKRAKLRIFAATDDLMIKVAENLGVVVEPWKLVRKCRLFVSVGKGEGSMITIALQGLELDEKTPGSIFRSVEIDALVGKKHHVVSVAVEPLVVDSINGKASSIDVKTSFYGHYSEPSLLLARFDPENIQGSLSVVFTMSYDPWGRKWEVKRHIEENDVPDDVFSGIDNITL